MSVRNLHTSRRNQSGTALDFTNANLVFHGNSWTNYGSPCFPGTNYGPGGKYPEQMAALSPWSTNGATFLNLATEGQTTQQMIDGGVCAMDGSGTTTAATTFIDGRLVSGRLNGLAAIEGGNDLYFNGNVTDAYNRLVTYYSARKAAGWKVVAGTVLYRNWSGVTVTPGGDTWSQYNVKVDALNALIRANWASFSNALADINAAPELDDPNDLTYFTSDKVHPNGAGRGVMAQLVSNAFLSVNSGLAPNEVLLIVFNGESNSGGIGENSDLTAGELAARSSVKIWNNDSTGFENLDIGTNNLLSHVGLTGVSGWTGWHGWEAGLANAVEAGTLQNPVYLVKTGAGGSTISQWNSGGSYETTMKSRINAAKAAIEATGKIAKIVFWFSLGINDRIAGTNESTWRTAVEAHFANIRTTYGATVPIHMTKFMSLLTDGVTYNPNADFNDTIDAIAAADAYTWAIDGNASLKDNNHWNAAGLKTLANRFITSTLNNL